MNMKDSRVDFIYLSEKDMIEAGVKDMGGCVDAMEEMFKLLKVGDFRMGGSNGFSHGCMVTFPEESPFPNMPLDGPDRRFMAMPAYLGGQFDMAGAKWYGSNSDNREKGLPRSILMLTLNDKDTGAPVAHMSANVLSAYRTGAIPGVGVKYLAHENAKVCGIVGPGVMGKTALASFIAVRPSIETVKIKGRSQRSIDEFVKYVKEEFPTVKNIEIVDDVESAVKDADVVCLATSATLGNLDEYPYVKEEWIKPGAVICCPASARFDEDFIVNRARTVVDCLHLYEAWAEEYPYPTYHTIPIPACYNMDLLHEGKITKDDIHDLGDILMGTVPARRNDKEITIYSVGGMPVEDIAWGTIVYRNALKKGIGTKLNLWEKPELA